MSTTSGLSWMNAVHVAAPFPRRLRVRGSGGTGDVAPGQSTKAHRVGIAIRASRSVSGTGCEHA